MQQIGGMNEDNFMYYEDVDLSWTINLMGYDIYCLPSKVYHKYRLKMTPEKLFWLERGRLSLLLCTLKPLTLVILLPFLALTELLVLGYCLIRGRSYLSAKLRALGYVVANISHLKQRRALIQRLRRVSDLQLFRKFQLNYDWGQLFQILR